jgi:hypothetical protein
MWTYIIDKFKDTITIYRDQKMFFSVDFDYLYPDKVKRRQKMMIWIMDTGKHVLEQNPDDFSDFVDDVLCPMMLELKDRL